MVELQGHATTTINGAFKIKKSLKELILFVYDRSVFNTNDKKRKIL